MKKLLLLILTLSIVLLPSCGGGEDNGAFYYSRLTAGERRLYGALLSAAQKSAAQTSYINRAFSDDEWSDTFEAFLCDNPSVFWLDPGNCSLEVSGRRSRAALAYIFDKKELLDKTAELDKAAEAAAAAIKEAAGEGAGAFALLLAAHDWLAVNTANAEVAGTSAAAPSSAYGALVERVADSFGYALAYKLLCDKLGVECAVVTGSAGSARYAWNLADFGEGGMRFVDVAWDDPDTELAPGFFFHNYFYANYEKTARDHSFDKPFLFEGYDGEGDYYTYTDAYASDWSALYYIGMRLMEAAVAEGRDIIELDCDLPEDVFTSVMNGVIGDVNNQHEAPVIRNGFRRYNASNRGNACIIRIFYVDQQ